MGKTLAFKVKSPVAKDTTAGVMKKINATKTAPALRNTVKIASNPLKKKA